jgi:hypothetical protein
MPKDRKKPSISDLSRFLIAPDKIKAPSNPIKQ